MILEGLGILALIAMVLIGLAILVVVIKAILFFIIPAVLALVVWLITRDPFLTGVAFLGVSVLCIVFRR